MHCRLFVKHLFFCVMVLSIGIHATNSVAESVDRLPKTTSILSMFAKAVVLGLAFGSQVQVLASPSSQKQTHSLNKRQEQQGSNACVANSDDIFYVGQDNLTRCLEQHQRGTFIFIERVNFTQFTENEKEKYPLYNDSVPFSGSLTMFPYSFDHFNITRFKLGGMITKSEAAAMFFKVENATIRANLTYPDVTGDYFAALIAGDAFGENTIELELDSAAVKLSSGRTLAGGVIVGLSESSVNHVTVRVKNYLYVSGGLGAGGLIGYITENASVDINAIIDAVIVECDKYGPYGGIIGGVATNAHIKINLKGSLIRMIDRPLMDFPLKTIGALYGEIKGPLVPIDNPNMQIIDNINIHIDNTNIQIDNVIIEGGTDSTASVLYADLFIELANHNITLIRGMHVNIQASRSNAIGIGNIDNPERKIMSVKSIPAESCRIRFEDIDIKIRKISPIYLLFINGTLGSPNHILAPEGVSCEGSMIDWSSVHLNTNNLGCAGALELETLRPEHWREAHRLVGVELCQDQENCFYVSEDLLTLVKRDHSFFLVTRQRYPYNNANDGQGIVRVIQYILDKSQYDPIINASFAINGTRLFTNATETLLSVERPLSTSLTDDHQLLMLYGETGNLKIASMPLIGMNDATYEIHTVQSSAAPVQIDKNILWLNQNGNLLAYNASSASTEIFSRNTTLSSWPGSVNLIGAQRYQDYVYTAQLENGTHLFMARFFNDGRQDANWTSSLPFAYDHTYHQLQISGENNEPIISFPHVTELYQHNLLNRSYTTIKLPSRGGVGEWHYSNESFTKTLLFIITPKLLIILTSILVKMVKTAMS